MAAKVKRTFAVRPIVLLPERRGGYALWRSVIWASVGLTLALACRSAPADRAAQISTISEPVPPPSAPTDGGGTEGDPVVGGSNVRGDEQHSEARALGVEPLTGPASRPLEVSGFQPAVVAVPVGAVEPRPLVIALHGNYDRPEWQCEVWQAALKGYPFVLCPRGSARRDVPKSEDRWTYDNGRVFKEEIEAALGALDREFSGRVADGGVFIGFSLGAIFAVPQLSALAKRFPYAVLIEGGLGALSKPVISSYRDAGGKRLLLACGQASCRQTAKGRAALATKLGVPTEVADGGNIGHTYDGAVAEAVVRAFPGLVAGAPSWAGAVPNPLAGAQEH